MQINGEDDWTLYPINGATGEAYLATRNHERMFIKRNTSPLVTALSAEGITPRLKWSQRTISGDILTAQEWTDASPLGHVDMSQDRVIEFIKRIHNSDYLLEALKRVGGQSFEAEDFINLYLQDLPPSLQTHSYFNRILKDLQRQIDPGLREVDHVVCHGDLHHYNFLLDEIEDILYLVDWESVKIADPISDITLLLTRYCQPSNWMDWFNRYGFEIYDNFYHRVKWYSLMNCLLEVKQYFIEGRNYKVNEVVLLIKSIYES